MTPIDPSRIDASDEYQEHLTVCLGHVLECAVAAVANSSTATFHVWTGAEISLGAAFDPRAEAVDRAQHADDSGPALSSIRTGEQLVLHRLVSGPGRYEAYRREAVAQGIASSLTVPVQPYSGRRGAFTYFADTADVFTDEDVEAACRYATVGGCLIGAAVALRTATSRFADSG